MGRNIRKILISKHNQKLLDHAKQSATDALKTSLKWFIQKRVDTTVNWIGNKIADKIIRIWKASTENNL